MYKDKRVLAVIPARGGSKGLPGKNIKPLNGKPLIAYSIEAALNSNLIDEIFISTDSKEIAEKCEEYGVSVPELRPDELAQDSSSTVDVLLYTLEKLKKEGKEFDYLLLLEPTSPLRKIDDIDNIIKLGIDKPTADGVISVGRVHLEHPSIVKKIDKAGYISKYFEKSETFYQRQLEDEAYFPYGVGYFVKVARFKETHMVYMNQMLPYYIERWQNYEIDDIYDFECIATVMKLREEEVL